MNKLERYGSIKKQIKQLELEIETLTKEVLEEVHFSGGVAETSDGKFGIMKRKVWDYPLYVTEAKEVYDFEKARSQEVGEAKYTEEDTLTFKLAK